MGVGNRKDEYLVLIRTWFLPLKAFSTDIILKVRHFLNIYIYFFLETVLHLHKTATESEVKQVASVLLRTAPDRVGGGGRVEEN